MNARVMAHRVRCPACGEWAMLRVAYRDEPHSHTPDVVTFACVNANRDGHGAPAEADLLAALSATEPD